MGLRRPTVSIIVPVFNAERAIPRLMASLRVQDYPRDLVQIVLVDNASTDRSAEVMRRYPEITALSQTEWQGPAATRNAGIQAAQGEALAFIDADCWADAHWLRAGLEALVTRGLDRVAGKVEFVLSSRPNIYEIYDSTINFQQTDFITRGWSGTGNLFVWRRLFDEVGLFDPALISHEDAEFGRRATAAGKSLAYVPEAVVYHRARTSLGALARKWMRTEYGAAQAWRRHGEAELHLWTRKANYRPLRGTWSVFPPEYRNNPHWRRTIDGISNVLRYAGNLGNLLGYFDMGRGRRKG